ncbi:hypothetical protein [Fuerstiella marisgermanici]|uniref:CAS/CSE protein involved in chromosome segregation n=1 Tax=Fuerstiella marisgermanici TaxID=1891926 RepID=A0A1P8WC01_9PLAN|nr:hypothetical protein [Fuerstiella marisgermanici]APZ91601.1 CAS/CSE protein involved in chromosome segregation [Fuerstiella marisgermanici]
MSDRKLYVLEPGQARIVMCDEDGQNAETFVGDLKLIPDGIVIDKEAGVAYFTQMGVPNMEEQTAYGDDGTIWKVSMDGSGLTKLVGDGGTRTPKQITLDKKNGKLYWGDREGLRVMRCNTDGSELEAVVKTGNLPDDQSDQKRWCVGVAVDAENGCFYWSQKGDDDGGTGVICRAKIDMSAGEDAASRSDVEILFDHLPEPIDLELDMKNGYFYWTDRGNLPGGNSVCRAKVSADGSMSRDHDVIVEGTGETIGVAFDHDAGEMFITSLTGELYKAKIEGGKPEQIGKFTMLTGLAVG